MPNVITAYQRRFQRLSVALYTQTLCNPAATKTLLYLALRHLACQHSTSKRGVTCNTAELASSVLYMHQASLSNQWHKMAITIIFCPCYIVVGTFIQNVEAHQSPLEQAV